MAGKYIAVDLGAESGRIMLGDLSDRGIALTEVHRFPNLQIRVTHSHGVTLHWDILRLWHEIKTGLAKIAAENSGGLGGAGGLGRSIRGIGVDTWGVDFALLDSNGALIANPVCYRDARTQGVVEKVFARLPQERIYSITGIQTMALNTLVQLASLSFADSPQLKTAQSGGHIVFLPDLFTYWLSGKLGAEYTIASTSQMLDARTRAWSPDILGAIGLKADLLPPMVMPGEKSSIRGTILATADETLARQGVQVIAVGSHDTASAVAAVPADSSQGDWLYLSSGTWSLLGAEVDQPVLVPKAGEYNITNEGGIGGKIRLLKNIAGLWLLQECRREWARAGQELDYATLTRMAGQATPGLAKLDVNDPAFASPGDMPAKITAQCRRTNQNCPSNPAEFTRVILESLAATYATVARMLEELTGKKFTTLHIVGGGSQNHLLNQLAADATGMRVIAGPVEATALGNILTQAISMGEVESLAAGRALVGRSTSLQTFEPRR